jgi:hypothetical protein
MPPSGLKSTVSVMVQDMASSRCRSYLVTTLSSPNILAHWPERV